MLTHTLVQLMLTHTLVQLMLTHTRRIHAAFRPQWTRSYWGRSAVIL